MLCILVWSRQLERVMEDGWDEVRTEPRALHKKVELRHSHHGLCRRIQLLSRTKLSSTTHGLHRASPKCQILLSWYVLSLLWMGELMRISLRRGSLSEPRGVQNHPSPVAAHWQTCRRIDSSGCNARKAILSLVYMLFRHLISPSSFPRLHSAWKTLKASRTSESGRSTIRKREPQL